MATAEDATTAWETDWKLMIEGICESTGLTRSEALLFVTAMQVASVSEEIRKYRKRIDDLILDQKNESGEDWRA